MPAETGRRYDAQVGVRTFALCGLALGLAQTGCLADSTETPAVNPAVAAPPATTPTTPTTAPPPRPFVPGPPVVRRLMRSEYLASIEDLLGPNALAVAWAPDDAALNGFDAIGAAQLTLGDAAVTIYEASARDVAAVATTENLRERFSACAPLTIDAADCMHEFVARFGRRAFRRPLTDAERNRWVDIGRLVARRLEGFDKGVEWVVSGMLQSPNFLYRVEVGEADPNHDGQHKLTDFEFATRLAFFLTGRPPDDALLDAAESGDLAHSVGIRAHAERLLATPAARGALEAFYDEMFRLRELVHVPKNAQIYPRFDADLAASMRTETLKLIEDLVWDRDADFSELFDANYTFVDARLADLYGVTAPASGFARVELPPHGKRAGLLGQASFLTLLSHAVTTSPTLRGKFIRETLLCQAIPAPPPNVNTTLPVDGEGQPARTMRERLREHQANPSCAACHVLMDGLGLGLENFDGIGAFRATDGGQTIDASGELDDQAFEGPRELGKLIRGQDRAMTCVVRNLYRHATGHIETLGEAPEIYALADRFAASGYRVRALLVDLTASQAFSRVQDVD